MFTLDEIDLLNKGLDALISEASSDTLIKGIFGVMMSSSKEEAEIQGEKLMQGLNEAKENSRNLEKKITLLKAKLIQLEDQIDINEATELLRNG